MHSSYLRNINGFYHFRIRIPYDLLDIVGFTEYQRSLKTNNLSLARKNTLLLEPESRSTCLVNTSLSYRKCSYAISVNLVERKKLVQPKLELLAPALVGVLKRAKQEGLKRREIG